MAAYGGSSDSSSSSQPGPRRAESASTLTGGSCISPIRLRGYYQRIDANTGEILAVLGSPANGGGTVLVPCNDRRASCCPACARRYERDAYQLIAAGLRGGKSVAGAVSSHPSVMLTLTAPSFGAVHAIRDRRQPCKCGQYHQPDDPQIGAAVDSARYRYAEQVIWNHYAPELWKRTIQAITRAVAHALGTPRSKLQQVGRVRFAKVAEFQRRGVVHYHAIIRIDGPDGLNSPAPAECTETFLEQIAAAAAEDAAITLPKHLAPWLAWPRTRRLRWGAQREAVALDHQTCTRAAGYIAKYATKATETATGGTVIKPIRSRRQLDTLELSEHARALISASWTIGEGADIEGLKRWAHQFGYGGHTLTKSRQYSTTFAALRAARTDWRRAANGEGETIVRAQLTYAGRGHGHRSTLMMPFVGTQGRRVPPAQPKGER